MAVKPTYRELEKRIHELERAESDRERTMKALQEDKARFQLLYERVPLGYQSLDEDGTLIEINPAWLNIFGYSRKEVIGKTISEFLSPDWRDHFKKNFSRFKSVGEILGNEFEMIKKDGSKILVSCDGKTRKDHKGNFKQTHCILHNITERKQLEDQVRRSVALLNATQQLTKVGGWEWNVEEQTIFWTDEVYQIHDFQPGEFTPGITEHIERSLECYDSEDRPVIMAAFSRCVEKGHAYDLEFPFTTARGRRILVRTLAKPVMVGDKVIRVVGNIMDITKSKQTEKKLRIERDRAQQYLDVAGVIFVGLDRDQKVILINRRGCDVLGYSEEEIIGKNWFEHFLSESNISEVKDVFDELMSDNLEPVEYSENSVFTKNGGERIIAWHNSVVRDDSGRIVSLLSSGEDISDRKKLEDQLRQAQKMESIGTLAGGIAHDFNNILYMITGNAELALEDTPEWNPVHDNLEEIKAAGIRGAAIVKQLLNFSRKVDHTLKPIDAVIVIKDALKFLRSMIPSTIKINPHLPDTDIAILADPVQIGQVLMNICTNASQEMEETGGSLTINVEIESLTQDAADNYPDLSAGKYVKIAVSDTGPGIDRKIIDRIFDPYFTTKEVGKGSGMGLAVVVGIIKNHSGAITVESQPGAGATFTILLPAVMEKNE